MVAKEHVAELLQTLNESEIQQVAEFIDSLRLRSRAYAQRRRELDPTRLAALYAGFADEDRALAEEDLADYCRDKL